MSGTADLVGNVAIGDNLHILREYVDDESIDLIYLDPPFNSNRAYSLIFKDPARGHSEAQAVAFKDQWTWNAGTEARFRDLLIPSLGSRATTRLSHLLANQVSAFERTQMAAYLVEMAVRLVELHRVLKPTGSLYLHCDPTASHYLKLLLDAIFGPVNFRNEIIWERATSHNMKVKGWRRVNDSLLFYTKSATYTFNQPFVAYGATQMKRYRPDENGRLYTGRDLTFSTPNNQRTFEWRGVRLPPNRYWGASLEQLEAWLAEGRILLKRDGSPRMDGLKVYLDETKGKPIGSNWSDIPRIPNTSGERLGYPTQKPLALLERIIAASSDPGDIVLDPFCGCGTAIEAARDLDRRWIGIDISIRALDVIQERFQAVYGEDVPSRVLAPVDEETARRLAETKPHGRRDFEAWALTMIGARKNVDRDRGVDGLIPFIGPRGRIQQALVSVKSGHTSPSEVRDLVGAVHRERSPAGIFLTLGKPTKEMLLEAARATPLIPGVPRIQILTIREALREDNPARPVLPAYRQGELFEEVPDAESAPVAELEDDLREAIAKGAAARANGQRDWRARLLASITEALEGAEPSPVSRAALRSPRTSRRDRPAPLPSLGSGGTD